MDVEIDERKLEIQLRFPNLALPDFDITSDIDYCYNCFAWAGGFADLNMQPSTNPIYGWLTGEIGEALDNFEKQFEYLGYKEKTHTAEYEEGFDKIAFYVKGVEVQHASRQLENGWWTTKLGPKEDITHKTLEGLEGEEYGKVGMILKRVKKVI